MNAQGTVIDRAKGPEASDEGESTIRISERIVEGIPGCLVFALRGYLDHYNTAHLRRHVADAMGRGFLRLVFDCERVSYMGSLPIGYLASLVKELGSRGGSFVLVRLSGRVQEVVQLLGLGRWFTQAQSQDEALALLAPQGSAEAAGPFPKVFDCPTCGKKLRVVRAGRYRCRECKTVVVVEASGRFSIR